MDDNRAMTITFDNNPFWTYSLSVYGKDGVSAACIALQDRHGLDVNLLLYCLWNGHEGGGVLTQADFDRLSAASAEWNADVICRLRAARLAIKTGFAALPAELRDTFRKRILEIEIDGERAEQLLLAPLLDRPRDRGKSAENRARDTAACLAAYLAYRAVDPAPPDVEALSVMLTAACPEADATRLLTEAMG